MLNSSNLSGEHMKDYLQDIVQHTHSLGIIDLVKVTGNDQETVIDSIAEDRSVIVQAKFKNPVPEFVGVFGMPNLGKLNTILNIPEYKEDAKLSINKQSRNNEEVPVGIHFENKNGDFKNDYRFMTSEIINEKLKSVRMKQVKWNVEFNPTVANMQRLKFQASANSEETTFVAKTNGTKLEFYFGDHSSHAGDFVFQDGVSGSLTKGWNWPVSAVIGILGLAGDKSMKISDEGVMQITVDSGIAEYNYLLPAQQK
jgi:hypothetical protein